MHVSWCQQMGKHCNVIGVALWFSLWIGITKSRRCFLIAGLHYWCVGRYVSRILFVQGRFHLSLVMGRPGSARSPSILISLLTCYTATVVGPTPIGYFVFILFLCVFTHLSSKLHIYHLNFNRAYIYIYIYP